jgi:hypothetical protein
MAPPVNQLVLQGFRTVPSDWINPQNMEPALEAPCSRFGVQRSVGRRSCGLALAAEDGKRHGTGRYE